MEGADHNVPADEEVPAGRTTPTPLTPRSRRRMANKAKANAWEELQEAAANAIDTRLQEVANRLDSEVRAGNTHAYWLNWSEATEAGLIDFLSKQERNDDPDDQELKAYRGRGRPTYQRR